ncbi:MAG: hypothetical protein HC858_07440 [Brachymonas sp.]|nr:hypothetical protein [Brachymonas sp.]
MAKASRAGKFIWYVTLVLCCFAAACVSTTQSKYWLALVAVFLTACAAWFFAVSCLNSAGKSPMHALFLTIASSAGILAVTSIGEGSGAALMSVGAFGVMAGFSIGKALDVIRHHQADGSFEER